MTIFVASFCSAHDILAGHDQLLVVTASDWNNKQGNLQLFERADNHSKWHLVGQSIPVMLGEKGLAWGIGLHPNVNEKPFKVEGDQKSPAGIFSLGTAFGFASQVEMNHLKMDYIQLNLFTEAVDDPQSQYYNCIVNNQTVIKDWNSSEKMGEEPLYAIGWVINHNFPHPQLGFGSAIFFHIWRNDQSGTAGCTAASKEELSSILLWMDKRKNPVLIQLPQGEYDRFQKDWNLPKQII